MTLAKNINIRMIVFLYFFAMNENLLMILCIEIDTYGILININEYLICFQLDIWSKISDLGKKIIRTEGNVNNITGGRIIRKTFLL